MILHKTLKRQFNRLGLDENSLPTDLNTWREFLQRVNQTYHDADQDKYLLERSMEISSVEMHELTDKLEEAQHIAHLGHWHVDLGSKRCTWSKELYQLFGLDPGTTPPRFDESIAFVNEDKRAEFNKNLDDAIKTGNGFETEFYIKEKKKKIKWYLIIVHPKLEQDGRVKQLSGIVMDVTKRKESEEELSLLNQQLVSTARKAGMSEVATAMLHNIGNVLNSVNVSLGIVQENLNKDTISKLLNAEKIIHDNKANLANFLTTDEKGKLIPDYLYALTQKFAADYELVLGELQHLKDKIEHIKEITAMQKSISGVSGIIEKVYLPEVIDTVINMFKKEFESRGIKMIKEIGEVSFIESDKAKLMQILINLIQNAKDALLEMKEVNDKIISIVIHHTDDIEIQVTDNGAGIANENLSKIFTFGFTTKKHGHGFGLHSSALAAKELGGSLLVESKGHLKGTTFMLTLPKVAPIKRKEYEPEAKSEDYSH